jgi:hypothetical protein
VADLEDEAKQLGIAVRTLRRAATEMLGIVPVSLRKAGKITGWTWTLTLPT